MEKKEKEEKEEENTEYHKDDTNIINKNKITEMHLNSLDEFIQKCLDNFKFIEPKQELYDATGADKNIIISHKSTIPDLVIWNKTFNKNNCFIGADTNKESKFPRYLFYIKIKKNKKSKKNNTENKNNRNNINNISNDFDMPFFEKNKNQINQENNSIDTNKNIIINNNMINDSNNLSNKKFKKTEEKNKFSMNQEQNLENNLNNINMIINLTIYLIQLYLYKDGWIILTKDNFSGPGTSIDLYQFLQEKLKENCNLDNFTIIDINKQVKFTGNNFYNILSNILQKILQKKQMELIKFEEIMNKQFNNNNNINNLQQKMNNMNINVDSPKLNNNNFDNNINNNNHININLYSNQIFPRVNYIGNINNNISNANFIQNNISNYEYNFNQYSNNKKKIQNNDDNLKRK